MFMYKRKDIPTYLDQKELPTRAYQAPKVIVPTFNLAQFKKNILYKGSSLWNELHTKTKNTETYSAFKTKQNYYPSRKPHRCLYINRVCPVFWYPPCVYILTE